MTYICFATKDKINIWSNFTTWNVNMDWSRSYMKDVSLPYEYFGKAKEHFTFIQTTTDYRSCYLHPVVITSSVPLTYELRNRTKARPGNTILYWTGMKKIYIEVESGRWVTAWHCKVSLNPFESPGMKKLRNWNFHWLLFYLYWWS